MVQEERVFYGLGVGPGIAPGVVHLHDPGLLRVPEFSVAPSQVEAEQHRFRQSVAMAGRQVSRLQSKARRLPAAAGEELGFLLDAYHQMLKGSRLVRGVEARIAREQINAEAAVRKEIALLVEAFSAMEDSYLAGRADDIRSIGQRLIRNLTRTPYQAFEHLPRRAVILSPELTPADTALLDPKTVAGFATVAGGAESHTAIMARSLALPAVVAVSGLMKAVQAGLVRNGDPVIIDGFRGQVIVNPAAETMAACRQRRADALRHQRVLARLRDVPACTVDGIRVRMMANIELPGEVEPVLAAGAEGVGLFRTEFLYMNRRTWPSEDEQYALLRTVVTGMKGRPVTIRTLDAGGDKLDATLGGTPPDNPALGLRAVRFLLAHPDVLEAQLAAILRAAAHGPVKILIPMVCVAEEVLAVRAALERVWQRLEQAGVSLPASMPPVGIMIEIPGAALAADALARVADFFAIGTNDLTQYTLAIDRGDEHVAALFNPNHPAVLRLIHFAAAAAQASGIPVSVCGEMAGDPRMVPLLLGYGIRELSMSGASIPRVKERITRLSARLADHYTYMIMTEPNPERIPLLLDELNQQAE